MHCSTVYLLWGLNTNSLDNKSKATGFDFGNKLLKDCFVLLGSFKTNSLACWLVIKLKSSLFGDPSTEIIFCI